MKVSCNTIKEVRVAVRMSLIYSIQPVNYNAWTACGLMLGGGLRGAEKNG